MMILKPKWEFGGPRDIWLKNIGLIERFVAEYKLEALGAEHLAARVMEAPSVGLTAEVRPIWNKDIRGGIRIPHLHLGPGVYLVNDEQWGAFSKHVISDVRARLGRAKSVSVEALVELSDMADAVR